jgi:protein TonB
MKVSIVAIVMCAWVCAAAQTESFEKRAMSAVQQMSASALDEKLPNRPFAAWFNELIGRDAGTVWQLAECGAPGAASGGSGQDLRACAEATVILPNGNRMAVAISVGTFKKGMVGEPAFFQAVVESGDQLYPVRRLRDLPEMLRSPKLPPRMLPDVQVSMQQGPLRAYAPTLSAPGPAAENASATPPPPPASPQQPRKVVEERMEGDVITRFKPIYPVTARNMGAYGKVEVHIVISESGRVIKATAISGHPALRHAAEEAARQWIYKPTTVKGVPTKVETTLVFSFVLGDR